MCPPGGVGIVVERFGRHRMQLARMTDLGVSTTTCGPSRATKAEAHQDLARARQSGTRKEMLEFVRTLRGRRGNNDDQDQGRIDEVVGASKGKRKRKAEAAKKGLQQVEDARTTWGVSLHNNGVAAAEATAARQEQASAEERERWAMRVAEVEARAAVACECARTWQLVADRRQRKCWTWAAWEKKQAAYSIWERERYAEAMLRELGSDSDD